MGNNASGSRVTADMEKQRGILKKNMKGKASGMSLKELQALQEQVRFEYPRLGLVEESTLVADKRLPDCPIVYANDAFEQMTLYPKERIIGVNCRFLQGPLTDKEVVKEIGQAVTEGRAIDVEILNYRADGVPFWNLFLMLPVHRRGKKSGPVEFFIAIQKDVSLIKGLTAEVAAWSAPEVCMWLEKRNFWWATQAFLTARVEGRQLCAMRLSDLRDIGIAAAADREMILAAIREDFSGGKYISAKETAAAGRRRFAAGEQVLRDVAADDVAVDIDDEDAGIVGDRIAFKIVAEGLAPLVVQLDKPKSRRALKRSLKSKLRVRAALSAFDEGGGAIDLEDEDEFEAMLALAELSVVELHVSKIKPRLRGVAAAALDGVAAPVMTVSGFGVVDVANSAAGAFFGRDVEGSLLDAVFDSVDVERQLAFGDKITVVGKDAAKPMVAKVVVEAGCKFITLLKDEK